MFGAVDLLCKSLRINVEAPEKTKKILTSNQQIVIAFWHGVMLVPWYLHGGKNFGALVSKSKDGELLTKVLTKWNYKVIRGSSHKGGKEALENILNLIDENYSVAITPDGPTGPPNKMKAGAVVAAKKTGIPLILLGVHYNNAKKLNSWDSFRIPKPFSKVCVVYSEPVFIDAGLTYDETSTVIEETETKLNRLQLEAEKLCLN